MKPTQASRVMATAALGFAAVGTCAAHGGANATPQPAANGDLVAVGTSDPSPGCTDATRIVERFANGASWDFCWSTRARDGLVVESARWTPPDGAPFPVLASGRLSQLHVAYDDNDVTYNDVTQYGLGGTWLQELTEADCPDGRLLAENGRHIACLYRGVGAGGWRGADASAIGERATLYAVSQVGAYTYIVTWHFRSDGALEPVVGASGALQRASDDIDSPFGRVLANDAGTVWLSHTHNYHWRLDLDLGARAGDDAFAASVHEGAADGTRTRTSSVLATEAAFALDPEALQAWHFLDTPPAPGTDPLAGRGYAISAPGDGHAYARPDVEPWSTHDLHVTVARDCERHASDNALYFPECADDVSGFVDGEPVAGADLVLWKRVSFHHVPRNEDRARMHTHWDGFELRPHNVASRTPGAAAVPTTDNAAGPGTAPANEPVAMSDPTPAATDASPRDDAPSAVRSGAPCSVLLAWLALVALRRAR